MDCGKIYPKLVYKEEAGRTRDEAAYIVLSEESGVAVFSRYLHFSAALGSHVFV